MRVKKADLPIFREFFLRTQTDGIDFLHELALELQKGLAVMKQGKKLLYMVDYDPKNRMVHIRMSDALDVGFSQIPPALQQQVLKEFGYEVDENGHFKDLTEKPESPEVQQTPRPREEKKEVV